MKRVLFIGVTKYNLERDLHLKEKFEGLSQRIKPYVLARGGFSRKKMWGVEFYLLPRPIFWLLAPKLAFWLCFFKKIDVIVCQGPLLEGLLGTILKKMLKKELIIEVHGDWEETCLPVGTGLPALKKFLSFFAKISLRNADKIRVVAHYLLFRAQKHAPDKPYFLFPTFTKLDDFLAEKDIKFDNYILFVGRADRVKGVKYLKEAFSLIENDFPEFKLVLVGEGLPEGKLSLAKVRDRMKNCYCLVLPSITEGLPRVLLEAMALGKPVIASNVGGIPDLIKDGENGFLFEVGDCGQLAEKLRILLNSKNLAVEMGKKGKELVEKNYSNERYIENYIKMINT